MKQTIPFTKDITFKTKIEELTSISLDNDLTLKGEDLITGNFYISGTYKMEGTVLNPEKYSYKIPATIAISDEYDTFDSSIDIDDFEYEVEGDTLKVKILVAINNLRKKEDIKEINKKEEITELEDNKELIEKLEDTTMDQLDNTLEVQNNKREGTFLEKKESASKEKDTYITYSVYIVKEEDTITSIKEKYNVTEESLKDYNDLDKFAPGVKLIVPSGTINSD